MKYCQARGDQTHYVLLLPLWDAKIKTGRLNYIRNNQDLEFLSINPFGSYTVFPLIYLAHAKDTTQ